MPAETARTSPVKRIVYILFSLGVTIGIFSYLLTKVSMRDAVRVILDANHSAVMMFLVLSLTMSFFRMLRYQLVLQLSGYSPGSVAMFLVVLVRNFFADLLPARLGTVIYIYLVNSRLGVPFGAATASFSLAFIFDIIALVPMVLLAAWGAGATGKMSVGGLITGAVVLAVITVVVLVALPFMFRLLWHVIDAMRFVPENRRQRWAEAFRSVENEITRARTHGVYFRLFVVSVMVRLAKYGALYVFLYALLEPMGYSWSQLNPSRAFLGICGAEFAASLPMSGIAGFGAYEGTWAAIFAMLGFPGTIAKLTGISHHLFTQVYGYLLGAAALVVLLLPWFKTADSSVKEEGRDSSMQFYGKISVATIIAALLLFLCLRLPLSASDRAKRLPPDKPTAVEEAKYHEMGQSFQGRILFDSNRSGTFGIYTIKADGTDLTKVVDTPAQEMYPDPSPDGQWLVFSKQEFLNKSLPGEIWICRRDGSDARKLADNGTFPTFSSDGKTVFFERERKKTMAVNADGTGLREIFPGTNREFDRFQIVKPRVSPDGKYVVFICDRKRGWNIWCAELSSGKAFHVASGCEAGWFGDSRRLAWILKHKVRERTGIYQFDMVTHESKELQDADAPRGHEYFPTVTKDNRFLLWGACKPGEHGHFDSNYQIFVRDLNGGFPVRITFDEFNNRWPKQMKTD